MLHKEAGRTLIDGVSSLESRTLLSPRSTRTQAAVIVDQNTKLSVFATRPAIYAPFFNWVTEFVGTAFKVAGVQGIYMQASCEPCVHSVSDVSVIADSTHISCRPCLPA